MSDYSLRKIAMGEREVLKKRRVNANCGVSYWHDEFTSDEYTAEVQKKKVHKNRVFGISKLEYNVSVRWRIDTCRSAVNGTT